MEREKYNVEQKKKGKGWKRENRRRGIIISLVLTFAQIFICFVNMIVSAFVMFYGFVNISVCASDVPLLCVWYNLH